MRRQERAFDPAGIARGIREERLGGIPERDLRRLIDLLDRYEWQTPLILTASLGPWFRENVGSAGAANYGMRLMALDTTTSLAATGVGIELKQGAAGRVWGGLLHSSATVTAGSVTLGVVLDSSATPVPLSDIVLNTTNSRSIVYPTLRWRRGIPFAAGQTVEPVLIVDASFAPTTADLVAYLFVAWEEPT